MRNTGPRHSKGLQDKLTQRQVEAVGKQRESYSHRPFRMTLWKKIFGAW